MKNTQELSKAHCFILDECLYEKLIRSHHGHHAISYAMFNCLLELLNHEEVIRRDGYTLQ